MKRFIVAIALLVFMSGAVMAEGMTFGIKGGLNLANLYGDDIDENKIKLAWGGGVFMNYMFTDAFSVQPEVLVMMKGTKADIEEDAGFKLAYIDIPILAKYTIPMEGPVAPSIFAGPYVGFVMSAKEYYQDDEVDWKDDSAMMDFGVIFGAGVDYVLSEGTGCITFDVRYCLGLTTLADIADLSEGEDQPDIKNSGIMFLVGYGFMF